MRYIFSILTFLLVAAFTPAAFATCKPVGAETRTAENVYHVYLNGKKIGHHIMRFEKSGPHMTVEAETLMQVKLLFISAFKYTYLSKETWCDDQLINVITSTYNNGERIETEARGIEGGYTVKADVDGVITNTHIYGNIMPSNHWNRTVLKQEALFDTVKAYMFPVTITTSEKENLPDFEGQRYDIEGDYTYSTYYGENDHWLGMSFYRGEKNFIEFRCQDCKNTLWPDAADQN